MLENDPVQNLEKLGDLIEKQRQDITAAAAAPPQNYSVEEIVTVHYREGKRAAVAFFNGHIDSYTLEEPMTRTEYNEFHQTHLKK